MVEFYIDTRVDLKTVFPHGPPTLRTLTLQGIALKSYIVDLRIPIYNLNKQTLLVLSKLFRLSRSW